jgi:hypothetical protein
MAREGGDYGGLTSMFWGYLVLMVTVGCFAALFALDRLREAHSAQEGRRTTYGLRSAHGSAAASSALRHGPTCTPRHARLAH